MGFIRRFFLGDWTKVEDHTLLEDNKEPQKPCSTKLKDNVDYLIHAFKGSSDLKIRSLNKGQAVLMYIETLADQSKLQNYIFAPIEWGEVEHFTDIPNARQSQNLEEAINTLLRGHAIYMEDGSKVITRFNVTSVFNRDVEEPDNEKVVRGAHDGFVENMMININLIRKRIEHRDLVVKYFKIGKKTNTHVAIVYMDGIADPEIIQKLEGRIKSISADMVQSPGHVQEFMEDSPYSPFPQLLNTERPDRIVANIMEGRIALMSEGSPTALVAPTNFFMFYQASDDYNSRWYTGTFIRLIRLTSFIIAVALPAFYIAVVSFHFEVIPKDLLMPVKGSINEIAYPPIMEALIMVAIVELIREAGIRLPTPVGQTIGIVGGLVIGDAVVRAGLVSNLMVIIVALTAIASFVVPSNELSVTLRLLTFPMMFLAGTLGFVGIVFGFLFLTIHLTKLVSFGSPYFAPITPLNLRDLKDTFVRVPLFKMKKRPKDAHPLKDQAISESREWVQSEQPKNEN
jgi:spore germination protein KA